MKKGDLINILKSRSGGVGSDLEYNFQPLSDLELPNIFGRWRQESATCTFRMWYTATSSLRTCSLGMMALLRLLILASQRCCTPQDKSLLTPQVHLPSCRQSCSTREGVLRPACGYLGIRGPPCGCSSSVTPPSSPRISCHSPTRSKMMS